MLSQEAHIEKYLSLTGNYLEDIIQLKHDDKDNDVESYLNNYKVSDDFKPIVYEYTKGSPISLCLYEILLLAINNVNLKMCENCGKYFVQYTNHKIIYCEREFNNSGKTCRQFGPQNKNKKKRENDPIYILFDKAYNRFRAKVYRDNITRKIFDQWNYKAVNMREMAKCEELSIEEYEKWISKSNDKKVIAEIKDALKRKGEK